MSAFQRLVLRQTAQSLRPAFRAQQSRFLSRTAIRQAVPVEKEASVIKATDNAFNRERAAVKAHAAATSGMRPPDTGVGGAEGEKD